MNNREESHRQLVNLCENIKALREQEGLSVEELAEQTGVPLATLVRLERVSLSRVFSLRHLFALADHFQVRPCELFL